MDDIENNAKVQATAMTAFGWVLALTGFLSGAAFSDGVYANASVELDTEIVTVVLQTVVDTKTPGVSGHIDQSPSKNPPADQIVVPVTQEAASEDFQPHMVASLENSILEHGESDSSISASTVLESSNGSVLSVPETEVEPTEPGEHILTSTEEMLPARGVSHQQVQEIGVQVSATRKGNVPARQPPISNEDDAGLPYAIILSLFALISLIPVARRNDHNQHHV